MTTLFLIRHGETEWNIEERVQGHGDSPLTARGRAQADALAARLAEVHIDAVYASDLGRVTATLAPVVEALGLHVTQTKELREKHFGEWESLTRVEIADAYPDAWHRYHTLRQVHTIVPGGETWDHVAARTVGFMEDVVERHWGQTVIIAGHGAALRPMILHTLRAPLTSVPFFSLDNAGISIIRYKHRDMARVITLNDCSHLRSIA